MSRFCGGRIPNRPGTGEQQIFFDALAEFAAQAPELGVPAIGERFGTPPGVGVVGRSGVGRGAVAAALAGAGVRIADPAGADVRVLVIAEALKPEERAELANTAVATMVVLNKADLTGAGRAGPLACAEQRAAQLAASVGLPVVPMIAHLATVELADADVAALRALVVTPAEMTSTDAFVRGDHPLSIALRGRLLERLDRYGLAHAVLAAADAASGTPIVAQLRALSQVDRVAEQLAAVGAPVRYRRVCAALRELRTLAAQSGDRRLDEFLTGDRVVLAVMAAAVEVVQASGFAVDSGDDADAQVRRAVHWRRRARGPVDALHQRCATDIARGSLRLLGRVQ